MEDFDNYYTVEFNGTKGWEVCWKIHRTTPGAAIFAAEKFKDYCEDDKEVAWRLTTPKV